MKKILGVFLFGLIAFLSGITFNKIKTRGQDYEELVQEEEIETGQEIAQEEDLGNAGINSLDGTAYTVGIANRIRNVSEDEIVSIYEKGFKLTQDDLSLKITEIPMFAHRREAVLEANEELGLNRTPEEKKEMFDSQMMMARYIAKGFKSAQVAIEDFIGNRVDDYKKRRAGEEEALIEDQENVSTEKKEE